MHPIEKLASAIAQSEGFYAPGSTAPKTNHNPGDLRASPLPRKKSPGGFVIFNSDQEGFISLVVQLMLYAQRGMTLKDAIYSWAPPPGPRSPDGGNNTALYLSETVRRTGVAAETKLADLFHFESIP